MEKMNHITMGTMNHTIIGTMNHTIMGTMNHTIMGTMGVSWGSSSGMNLCHLFKHEQICPP